jgi:predicted permease
LVTARVWLPRPNDASQGVYLRPDTRVAFYRETLRRVGALPGVEQAAMSNQIPLGGYNAPIFFEIEGKAGSTDGRPTIHSFQVSPSYFATMRIPIVRGRGFNEFDRAGSEPVVMISAAAARAFWANDDPVGQRIRLGTQPWMTIVGVSGDVHHRRLDEPPQPILYQTLEQASNLSLALLVRTRGPQPDVGEILAREVRAVDPNLPLYSVRTMDDLLARAVAQRQFLMRMVAVFGATAIGLALLGLYAVISYAVSQRTREIGIRIALGARQIDVSQLVLLQGMWVTGAGMVVGLVVALPLSQFMRSQIFGVRPFDPGTLVGAVLVMGVTAIVAVYLPARRAARIDPIRALRAER